MKSRYCRICKDWHQDGAWPSECMGHWQAHLGKQRSTALPIPNLIRDQMDPLLNYCDGVEYESKSEFRKVLKAHNKIEIGTEAQKDTRYIDEPITDDVRKAVAMVEQGYKPSLETETVASDGFY